jgi:hypothetical protein
MNISMRSMRLSRMRPRPSFRAEARLSVLTREGDNVAGAIYLFVADDAASISGYAIRVHRG